MKNLSKISLVIVLAVVASCKEKEVLDNSNPLATAKELLKLHDLLGKQPEQRTEQDRKNEVDRESLGKLIADLKSEDAFLTDLYIGFVVGALARTQEHLVVSKGKKKARIAAGNLNVRFLFVDNGWKIVLKDTVPEEIKKKALAEKAKMKSRSGPQ